MFEIFINDTKLILSWKKLRKIKSEEYIDSNQIVYIVKDIFEGKIKNNYCLYSKNITFLFQEFINCFRFIRSSGGLVFHDKKILWIYRYGKWDLPKGVVEKDEKLEDTAIREIGEECCLKNLVLEGYLGNTMHMYMSGEDIILKEVVWYKFHSKDYDLVPQSEENITKAEWKTKEEHTNIIEQMFTYNSIGFFLKKDKNYFFYL